MDEYVGPDAAVRREGRPVDHTKRAVRAATAETSDATTRSFLTSRHARDPLHLLSQNEDEVAEADMWMQHYLRSGQ